MAKTTEHRMRRMLRALLVLGIVGLGGELALIGHSGGLNQSLPLIALGLAAFALALDIFSRSRLGTGALRVAMVGLIAIGGLGVWFHHQRNFEEYRRDMGPEPSAWEVFVASMQSHWPPALAPGALALLGGIGLVSTCGVAALRRQGEDG